MKKLSAILLVLCMMMSMVISVPTFAEDVASLTIQAESSELIKGFNDNSGAETPAIEAIGSTYARIRQGGEWISYDISSLKEGTYSVSVTWRNVYRATLYRAGLDFIVDGELELRSYTPVSGSAVEQDKLIGNIFVPAGAEELKIKNHGYSAIDLDAFTLTFVGAKDTSSKIRTYAQNATSVNDVTGDCSTFALGTDYYDYRCNAYDESKYTEECDHTCAGYEEGKGWHFPFENGNVTAEDYVTIHNTNWVRYDISDIKAGYYNLTLHISQARNGSAVSFCIDSLDNEVVSGFALKGVEDPKDKSSWGPAYDDEVGVIYIPENATYMYMANNNSGRTFRPSYFELEHLDMMVIDKDTECVSFDAHDEDLEEPLVDGDYVVYEPSGEWISYDISSLKAGTYEVTLDYLSADVNVNYIRGLDFVVDGELELRSYLEKKTASGASVIGKIFVPKGAEELKIKNHGFYQIKVKNVLLNHVSDEDTSENIVISAQNATSTYSLVSTPVESAEPVDVPTYSFNLGTDYYDSACKPAGTKNYTVPCGGEHFHNKNAYSDTNGYHLPYTNYNVISSRADATGYTGYYLQHHQYDWTRFDISDLKPGYYDVKYLGLAVRNGNAAKIAISLDTKENVVTQELTVEPKDLTAEDTTNFGSFYDAEAGTIYIPENTTYMYLYNLNKGVYQVCGFEFAPSKIIDKNTKAVSFNAHDKALTAPKTDGDYVVYEPSGEWISYDVSSFEAGTYEVVVDYLSDVRESRKFRGLDFVVNGELELRSYLAQKVTSAGVGVGKIYLPEGAKELKIKNHGLYQIKVKTVSFNYIDEEDSSEAITISAQNATSSYVDGEAKVVLLEDYFDSSCKTSAVENKQDQASTAHLAEGATCYHYPFTHTAVATGEYVQHNPGEWTRYDISDLKPGTYQVEANIWVEEREGKGPVVAELILGDITNPVAASSVITPVYEEVEEPAADATAEPTVTKTYQWSDAEIGVINVTEDDDYLIIRSYNKGDYYQLKSLTFKEYVPDATTVFYSSDAEGENIVESLDGLNTAYVNVNLLRPRKPESIDETIIVALYDGSKLESVQSTPVTVGYEFDETYTVTGLSALAEPTIKVFVWDNLTGMSPVIENEELSISYTSQYLGEGFTRLNLKDTSFKAEKERVFDVEIKENGEYAIFFAQEAPAANSFAVSFEKDGEEIVVSQMAASADDSYGYIYSRIGAIAKGESGSVSLTEGTWNLKFKALNDADISYIDIRSTIISVPNEALGIYLGDYNLYETVASKNYVNAEISNEDSAYPRAPLTRYFADYTNGELAVQNSSARGIILSGNSKAHTYKLDIEQADTYKITALAKTLTGSVVTAETAVTTLDMAIVGGDETSYTHTYEIDDPRYAMSPLFELELITDLDAGLKELTFTLNNHRAYFYRLLIEPYEEEIITATENGAEFTLTKPEVVQFVNDARKVYVTPAYADYTTSISQNYGMNAVMERSDRPLPAALVWDELQGAESYTLYVSENEDLEDAKVFTGITGTRYDVYNLLTNHKYYWKVVGNNGAETDVLYFTTKNTVRFIYADGGANIRDIGGWNGLNLGMAYRGAQPDGYDPKYGVCLTEAGIDTFLNDLKIKTDLDLRGDCQSNILGIAQIYAPVSAYTGAYSTNGTYTTAIRAFADIDNYPIYFHCAGGADRTGTVAYIVEAIAGATEEDMAIDFELTGASQFSYRFRHREAFVDFLVRFKAYDGDTLQEKAVNYAMETLGLTRQEVSNIQSLMAGNMVVFNDVNDLSVGENTIALKNYKGQALSSVIFNGAVLDAELNNDGELTVTFEEAGTGEIVFADGTALKFVVA